jgi:putative polyhydroxyalkanoate system protein
MAHIEISRAHKLGAKKARTAAEKAGKHLAEKFDMQYRWADEGELKFERPGVRGQLELDKTSVRIVVSLGLMLLPFKSRIEQEIHKNLDQLFGAKK